MSNRYEIKEKIGQGGVGAVFKALDTQLKREVALKRLVPSEFAEGNSDDVLKEATTLSALQHPNIVTVYDVGQDSEGPFVVMELLKGENFDDTITRGALTEGDFRAFVSQTLEAVIAAHDREMIHRDIKPGNLMLIWLPSGKFQVKILDFGLAKFGKQPSKQTTDHEDGIMGSIFFMAPEQFERVELDERTDLYALGCIYYYALTTKYPYGGETPAQVMAAHLRHQVRDLSTMRPDLPKWMCDWVHWLISREMKDRPESAVQALEYFNRGEVPVVQETVDTPSGKKLMTGPVTASAAPAAAAASAGTASQNMRATQPGQPAMAIPAGTASVPAGGAMTGPIAFAGPPVKKKSGFPVWAYVTIPLLLALLAAVIVIKNQGREKQRELNMQILQLTEEEVPEGDPETVDLLLDFVRVGSKESATQLEQNNALAVIATLGRMEGDGVDDALVSALRTTEGKARAGVINVLNTRELASAINQVAPFLADKYTEEERSAAVTFIGWRGTTQELTDLIGALKTTESEKTRQTFENAIVNLSSQIDDPSRRTQRIITNIPGSTGPYRLSLLKILTRLGGKEAWETVKLSLGSADADGRRTILLAMSGWPDSIPLEDLYGTATTSKETSDSEPAARAVVAMLNRPNPLSADQQIDMINGIYKITASRRTKMELINAASRIFDPKTVDFLNLEAKESGQIGAMAKDAAKNVQEALDQLIDIGDATSLAASSAIIRGEGKIAFDKKANAITGWDMETTMVSFPVRFNSAGAYKITVVQAVPQQGGSDYQINIGDQTVNAKTKKTGGDTKFKPVDVGKIKIQNPGIYMLNIIPLRISDYRLMNFRTLKLERDGGNA